MKNHRYMRILGVAILLAGCLCTGNELFAEQYRTWKSASGNYEVRAKLLDQAQGVVRLRRVDGQVVNVPIARLSPADVAFLKSLTQKKAEPAANQPAADSVASDPALPPSAMQPVTNIDQRKKNFEGLRESTGLPRDDQMMVVDGKRGYQMLVPFMQIRVPEPGPFDSPIGPPPIFQTGSWDTERIILIVLPPKADSGARLGVVNAAYNGALNEMQSLRLSDILGQSVPSSQEIPKRVSLDLKGTTSRDAGTLGDGGDLWFGLELVFEPEFTYVFQATAASRERTDKLLSIVDSIKPIDKKLVPAAPGVLPLTSAQKSSLSRHVKNLIVALKRNDADRAIPLLLGVDAAKELKKTPQVWEQMSQGIMQGSATLVELLEPIDFDKAFFDEATQTAMVAIGIKKIGFRKTSKGWILTED